jgi:hypothetical protein
MQVSRLTHLLPFPHSRSYLLGQPFFYEKKDLKLITFETKENK